ncbi:hypothetical protein GTID1_16470 [Geobacillus thermodenitrificans]|jgi:hypothetical protein|nr:hypothetical protein GTID1_16470 [Geobacillus thermodenitrificans]
MAFAIKMRFLFYLSNTNKESTLFALSIERSLLPSKRKVEGKVNLSFEVTIIFSFKNGNSIKD